MKRAYRIFVAMIAILLFGILLCACNANNEVVVDEQGGQTIAEEQGEQTITGEQCDHKIAWIKGKEATCSEPGLTAGKYCSICDAVLLEQEEIAQTAHNYNGTFNVEQHDLKCRNCKYVLEGSHNLDSDNKCEDCDFEIVDPPKFASGYITTEYTEIETEHFICKLDAHTYVRDDLEYCLETLYEAIQITSGLKFNTEKFGKIVIEIEHIEPHADGHIPEIQSAYAALNKIVIGKGNLFISGGSAIAHELTHVLKHHNSHWFFCRTMEEGFAVYTQYKTVKYLEENHPEIGYYLATAERNITDMIIEEEGYSLLFAEPFSYWCVNGFPHAVNNDYTVGFRFMRYLDEVYGDYSSWITKYQELNPQDPYTYTNTNSLEKSEVVKVMPMAYGEDVEDNFYPWLKENLSFFEVRYIDVNTDRTKLEFTNLYPSYWYWLDPAVFTGFQYKDVYFNIDQLRNYITEYKGDALGNFRFECKTLEPATIKFYDSDGRLLSIENSPKGVMTYSLDGVGFIQFVGKGTITKFDIFGFGSIE